MSPTRAWPTTWLVGGALAAGCAPPHASLPSPVAADSGARSCLIQADSAGAPRRVTAVFADSAGAERARSAGTLETPVWLDCEGRAHPGLAAAWSRDSAGRFWTLELGAPADGGSDLRWTASSLAAAWRASVPASEALRLSGVESLLPLDERRLVLGFSSARADLPPLFADPALGVPRAEPLPTTLAARASDGDLRDALDGGADLVVSADPALLDYAARRPGLTETPLPWSRSYVLLVPAGLSLGGAIPSDTSVFRAGLARDAVRADARAAAAPFWWDAAGSCARAHPEAGAGTSSVITYREDDATARELAERLVALAGAEGLAARAVPSDSFAAVLRRGGELAYVVAVPVHALVPCRAVADWPAGASVIPLVDTRDHAILRRGTPPLVVGWDGTLRSAAAMAPPRSP